MGKTGKPVARLLCVAFVAWVVTGADPYTAPDGDLNRDGVVDAVDLQCEVLLFDALQGAAELTEDVCVTDDDCPGSEPCRAGPLSFKLCYPACLSMEVVFGQSAGPVCSDPEEDSPECLGTVGKPNADFNCDEEFSNVDFQFLVALVMDKAGGAGTADQDGDGQLNFCDPDSDDDEVEDPDDCSALDPAIGICFDGDPCTQDVCEDGGCVFPPATGPLCDDELQCTHSDSCVDGTCIGTSYVCNDGDVCTDDACTGAGGCSFVNNTALCDDTNPCTSGDVCGAGQCAGTPYSCNDSNVCTDDWCNGNGTCGHSNNSVSCGPNHQCQGGQCVALCSAGDYPTWSGTCSAFCSGMGCGSAQVFGAPHSNLCGCTCCSAATGGTASGPYGGGFSDCQLVQEGWIPYCATTCRCGL